MTEADRISVLETRVSQLYILTQNLATDHQRVRSALSGVDSGEDAKHIRNLRATLADQMDRAKEFERRAIEAESKQKAAVFEAGVDKMFIEGCESTIRDLKREIESLKKPKKARRKR